uniref:Uncharacterized protein n=1 Tax=Cannabis sativa TaxID=3483 RepID=A0A803PDJ8_CANSA
MGDGIHKTILAFGRSFVEMLRPYFILYMVTCPFIMACLEWWLGFTVTIGDAEFGSWFESFCNTHPGDSIDKLAMILWGIWGARNDLLWNKKIASVERVVSPAITYFELWKVAQLKNGDVSASTSQASAGSELWSKPSLGELKVNCDTTIFSREKSHDLGWITRDFAAQCLACHVGHVLEHLSMGRSDDLSIEPRRLMRFQGEEHLAMSRDGAL